MAAAFPPSLRVHSQVKGCVKLVNNGETPLVIKHVLVKIACEGGSRKPIIVKATCPGSYYESDYSYGGKERSHLTLPSTATTDKPVRWLCI